MNSVEMVKKICMERHIPIAKLERDLGFANGYIRSIKKGMFPADRMKMIADYLNVPESVLLMNEEQQVRMQGYSYYLNEKTAKEAQEMYEDPDMRALHHMKRKMDPETFKAHMDMMKRMYRLEHPEDDDEFIGS